MSGLLSPYDTSRSGTTQPAPRLFQATTHMGINMPLFTGLPLATSVPYQSGVFALDTLSVNPYNLQQSFPVGYSSVPHTVQYPNATNIHTIPTMPEVRIGYPLERGSPAVKAEVSSPVLPDQPYIEDSKQPASESGDGSQINFSTDVDTLMRAIQAKQKSAPERRQSPLKVGSLAAIWILVDVLTSTAGRRRGTKTEPKADQEIPMQHARLQQEILPENASRNTHSGPYWH